MTSPYANSPYDAFLAAQGATAFAVAALIVFRPTRSWLSRLFLLFATFVAAVATTIPELERGLGHPAALPEYLRVLDLSALLVTAAMLFSSPRWLVVVAVLGEALLFKADRFFTDQTWEVAALHLSWIGAVVGFERLADTEPEAPAPYPSARSYWPSDLALAALAVVMSALVGHYVLQGRCDSADEWAYTFQAATLAKLRAYSVTPHCYDAFQSFWVFEKDGRLFSQYLPGWPMFMAPFVAINRVWLAAPVSLGVLVIGVSRLARRAAAASVEASAPHADRQVRMAGTIAALAIVLSDTMLINGGSRFPHIWLCAMFAWAIEAICVITSSPVSKTQQTRWGVVLGCSLAWLLATRHIDGCLLGVGLFVYVTYAFTRGRLALRAIAATVIPFAIFGGLTLVVLRLQLGKWFATGYSLTTLIHTWNKFAVSVPKPNEWRWGIPIGTGSYCWWPLAPAIGIAGMIALCSTRERRLAFMLCLGSIATLGFYTAIEFGRGWDFGYGPRYQLVVVVPMAVGAGVMFAPPFAAAFARLGRSVAMFEGGPAAVAIVIALFGAIRIAPLVYPLNYEDIRARNVVFDAIERDHLTNAVVWLEKGATISDWLDLSQNMPPDLYPDDVLVLLDRSPDIRKCVRDHWPGRRWYRTQGGQQLTLVPE